MTGETLFPSFEVEIPLSLDPDADFLQMFLIPLT